MREAGEELTYERERERKREIERERERIWGLKGNVHSHSQQPILLDRPYIEPLASPLSLPLIVKSLHPKWTSKVWPFIHIISPFWERYSFPFVIFFVSRRWRSLRIREDSFAIGSSFSLSLSLSLPLSPVILIFCFQLSIPVSRHSSSWNSHFSSFRSHSASGCPACSHAGVLLKGSFYSHRRFHIH